MLEDYTTRKLLAQAKTVVFGLKPCKNLAMEGKRGEDLVSLFLASDVLQWP